MLVDAHMHIGVWDHPDFLRREATLAQAIDVLRGCEISGAAVMPTDQCDNAGLLSEVRAHRASWSGCLWMFAWVRPTLSNGADPGAADLAWVRENRAEITGIKLHPSLSRMRVTEPGFAPALELAAELDLVVLVHCGRWQEKASYRFAIEAAGAYPATRFLLAHAGGDTPPLATQAAELVRSERVDNVWFDFSGLREYWVIERNVAHIGAERYLMGSDYSLAHPRMYLGAIAGMSLPDAAKAKILGENAAALFGAPVARSEPAP